MALVGYSPYEDAAGLGQGLGNAFAQLALELPKLKAQQLLAQTNMAKLPYELALTAAETAAAKARGGEYDSHANLYKQQTTDLTTSAAARSRLASQYPVGGDLFEGFSKSPLQDVQGLVRLMALKGSGIGTPDVTGSSGNMANAAIASGMPQLDKATVIPNGGEAVMPGGAQITNPKSFPPGKAANGQPQLRDILGFVGRAMGAGSTADEGIDAFTRIIKAAGYGQPDGSPQPAPQPQPGVGAPQAQAANPAAQAAQYANQIASQNPGLSKDQIKKMVLQHMSQQSGSTVKQDSGQGASLMDILGRMGSVGSHQ